METKLDDKDDKFTVEDRKECHSKISIGDVLGPISIHVSGKLK